MKAINIAKYIIDFCNRKKLGMSCRKLQYTLYFLQADFLINEKHPLFEDNILTSSYGVVIREVEDNYRLYGNANIPSWPLYDFDLNLSKEEKKRIEDMVKRVSLYTSTDLLKIIFQQEPFKNNKEDSKYKIIPLEDLYNFFKD